jgi:hypothetical protein
VRQSLDAAMYSVEDLGAVVLKGQRIRSHLQIA